MTTEAISGNSERHRTKMTVGQMNNQRARPL